MRNSLDFAELTKKLQQERVSVALKFFIKDRESNIQTYSYQKARILNISELSKITEFDSYVKKNVDPKFLNSFTTVHTFNETDQVLQNVVYWPKISEVEYFKTKLKFQIQHSLFR